MRDYRRFFCSAILLLGHSIAASAADDGTRDIERQKEKIVSRMVQATYVAEQRCSATAAGPGQAKSLSRFRSRYPELISLMEHSPYYTPTREYFQNALATNALPKLNETDLLRECQGLESILRALMDAPGGTEAVAGYVELLKK